MRGNVVFAALIVALAALLCRLQEPGWVDMLRLWRPLDEERSCAYRFWLPRERQRPLAVTLIKANGGIHNRGWTLTVEESAGPAAQPIRLVGAYEDPSLPPAGPVLLERSMLARNDCYPFDEDPIPRMLYRAVADSYEFLVDQPPSADFPEFESGPFLGRLGQGWERYDSW